MDQTQWRSGKIAGLSAGRHGFQSSIPGRDLARIFMTGCPNWDFKNLGCPKSLIEKVKIITLIMYINILSNYMLNFSRSVLVIF